MLAGSERLIHHLVTKDSSSRRINNSFFNFLTNTVRILPLPLAVRTTIGQTIKEQCSNAKNLVFVLLIADNSLVVLVHRHSYFINVSDLRQALFCCPYFMGMSSEISMHFLQVNHESGGEFRVV